MINEDLLKELPKPWQKFFLKFKEIDSLDKREWKDTHILAYLSKKHEELYGRALPIAIKGAPSKCAELFFIKKMKVLLSTVNPVVIVEYIDWIFEKKLAPKRYPLKTLGFFIVSSFVPEFLQTKETFIKPVNVSRSTEFPPSYKELAKELDIDINGYSDLAFIQMKIEKTNDTSSKYFQLMENLKLLGLDINKLKEMV